MPLERLLGIAVLCVVASACYHYEVVRCEPYPQGDGCSLATDPGTYWAGETLHTIAWGLAGNPSSLKTDRCRKGTAIDQIRIDDNFLYTVATVGTFGFWNPKYVRYRCTKPVQPPAPQPGPNDAQINVSR